ncbi:MAG: transporter permease [Leifsonia sp.]|nr:transporter permease [Leifsonia sp.]
MTTQVLAAGQRPRKRTVKSPFGWIVWAAVIFFFINLFAVVAAVVVNSFGTQWFDTWLPSGWTLNYYATAWQSYQLSNILVVTVQVALTVVVISLVIGAPAAYVLARRNFPGKKLLMLCFLLPIMVPPITYGIPLATLLYQLHLGGTLAGVLIANIVPAIPFVILVLTPFIEQIDPNIESAARMCGARTWQVLLRILMPLIIPGLLAAALLVLVQTVALFEMTFLVSGPGSQTLVVALYYAVFASGIRPAQAISAMAVIYMLTTLVVLVIALRYVSPTQMVAQVREPSEH